jgi:hypothetical protein
MDAKVHPARPDHRDAEEMIGLVLPALRRTTAVESVDRVAGLDVAVRHHRRNFRELFPEPVRDSHPSALAAVEKVYSQERPGHSAKLLPVALADRELVAQAVVVAKVVGRLERVLRVVAILSEAHLAAAMAHRAGVIPDAEPLA